MMRPPSDPPLYTVSTRWRIERAWALVRWLWFARVSVPLWSYVLAAFLMLCFYFGGSVDRDAALRRAGWTPPPDSAARGP